jgi:hypothetical protein
MVGIAYLTELFVQHGILVICMKIMHLPIEQWVLIGGHILVMMFCNLVSPQVFWFRKLRRNVAVTFAMSILINIGMWFERFVIIVIHYIEIIYLLVGCIIHQHGLKWEFLLVQ